MSSEQAAIPLAASYGWTDESATCSTPYLLPAVLEVLDHLGPRSILDIGCGNGSLTRKLGEAGYAVTGCDADAGGIALARRAGPRIRFEHLGVHDDPASLNARFDAIVSTEVVEHLFDPAALPCFAGRALCPGGHLVITTPYHGYLKNLALAAADRWDSHHGPLTTGGHVKFFSRATLTRLLEDAGFVVTRFRGVGRLPYLWKSMLLVARWPGGGASNA